MVAASAAMKGPATGNADQLRNILAIG